MIGKHMLGIDNACVPFGRRIRSSVFMKIFLLSGGPLRRQMRMVSLFTFCVDRMGPDWLGSVRMCLDASKCVRKVHGMSRWVLML